MLFSFAACRSHSIVICGVVLKIKIIDKAFPVAYAFTRELCSNKIKTQSTRHRRKRNSSFRKAARGQRRQYKKSERIKIALKKRTFYIIRIANSCSVTFCCCSLLLSSRSTNFTINPFGSCLGFKR